MPEDQINEVFDALMQAAAKKKEGQDLSGVPAHARPAPAAVEPPKLTKDRIKELMDPNHPDFDPTSVFKSVIEENYGGLIGDISRNAQVGLKADLRRQLPDFAEYEADVDKVLEGAPNVNQAMIANAYFTVKGLRTTQKEIEARNKKPTTAPPSPAKTEITEPAMSQEDIEVAKVMFRGSADPIAEYKKAQAAMEKQYIRVPGDPKPAVRA